MLKTVILVLASAASMAISVTPAMAQAVAVSTDETLFDSQRPGIATYTFPFTGSNTIDFGPTYSLDGVTFTAPDVAGHPANTNDFAPAHLGAFSPLTVAYNGPVLGLILSSYSGAQTISYLVNGVTSGTLFVPGNNGTAFIGFDTGSSSTIRAVFTFTDSLDVASFQTALPEPASWAMMIGGFGIMGGALRTRRSPKVSFA